MHKTLVVAANPLAFKKNQHNESAVNPEDSYHPYPYTEVRILANTLELETTNQAIQKKSFVIEGPDCCSFLNNLTTQLTSSSQVSFHCVLNPKGSVRFEFWCFPIQPDKLVIFTDQEIFEELYAYLDMVHFAEKIELRQEDFTLTIIESDEIWQDLNSFKPWSQCEIIEVNLQGKVGVFYSSFSNIPGIALIISRQLNSTKELDQISFRDKGILGSVFTKKLREIESTQSLDKSQDLISMAKIFSGGFLPFQALKGQLFNHLGFFRTYLNEEKGCYPGQEIVTRIAQRGKTTKKLFPKVLTSESNLESPFPAYPLSLDQKITCEYLNPQEVENKSFPYLSSGKLLEKSKQLYNEALDLFHQGDYPNSTKLFQRAIEIDPQNPDFWEGLGVNFERQGQMDLAIKTHREFSRLSPKSVMAWANLSRLYMLKGWIDKAEEVQEIARALHFEASADEATQSNQAIIEAQKQLQVEKEQRKKMFESVLEIDPEDDIALFGLGKFYVDKKEPAKALEYLVLLLELKPDYAAAWPLLAKAYIGVENYTKASESIELGKKVCQDQGAMVPLRQLELQMKKIP